MNRGYKDASEIIANTMSYLYFKQGRDDKVRFLLSLYIQLTTEQQSDFLRLAKVFTKAQDADYLHQ